MNINPKEIKHCLDIAASKRDAYFAYAHNAYNPHINVNSLLKNIKESDKIEIELSFFNDEKDHHFHSFILNIGEKKFKICIVIGSQSTNCWKRFALCKELFHVILDNESSRSINLQAHLQDFTSSILGLDNDGNASSKNEVLAEFAAMEFLFPYAKRLECLVEIEKSADKKALYISIAEKFRIPRLLVEEYLSTTWIEFFEPISWINKASSN